MNKILIIGAASAIAEKTFELFCKNNENIKLYLLDLKLERLATIATDIKVKYPTAEINYSEFDVNNYENHSEIINKAISTMNGLDAALIAHGTLPDQTSIEYDSNKILSEFSTNGMSVILLSTKLAEFFEKQGRGCIAVISSVAGDRGRKSNYIYGTAKGAVSIYLQGLRARVFKSGVKIITIKPGLVDTPMTKDVPKNFLFASPEQVASGIYKSMISSENNKEVDVVYLPSFWKYIMFIIKIIPERIFKKLNL